MITSWEWDVGDDGSVDLSGSACGGLLTDFPSGQTNIRLTVTDNQVPAQSDSLVKAVTGI